ncbi:hypothetical protein CEXT_178681 [Caerostris extrusa]|uniref:Uncharacterized protein n=1 Tax=Caerostris extrusa TaxID=172846 RepID=A0AAV4NX11_CAEEX|nr:hypothetical protein CEXT_178681 [Caerostris extrusa]
MVKKTPRNLCPNVEGKYIFSLVSETVSGRKLVICWLINVEDKSMEENDLCLSAAPRGSLAQVITKHRFLSSALLHIQLPTFPIIRRLFITSTQFSAYSRI